MLILTALISLAQALPQKGSLAASGSLGAAQFNHLLRQLWADPRVEYFVSDHVSLGGFVKYRRDSESTISFGPAASVHYALSENSLLSLGLGLEFGQVTLAESSTYNFNRYSSALVYRYFLNPYVAIGPELNYSIQPETDELFRKTRAMLIIGFSILL